VASTKGPRGPSVAPLPAGVGRRMERKRQKLVGQDKGSLTEQQTKPKVTTTLQRRRTYKTDRETHGATLTARCPVRSRAATAFPLASSPTGAQRGGTWYGIPCSVWPGWVSPPGCVLSWLLVKVNPVLAKPRTTSHKEIKKTSS